MTTSSLLLGALFFGALTPAKVDNVQTNSAANPSTQPPHIIYVERFSMDQVLQQLAAAQANNDNDDSDSGGRPHLFGMFRGGEQNTLIGQRKEKQYEDTLRKLPGILQDALVDNLDDKIAPATDGDDYDARPRNSWVVTGQFLIVNPGNRAMQAGVGFGAGQSQVEVHAQVYTLRDRQTPFLVFNSKGASGHMPGAVVMMNPYVAAAKFVMSKKEPEKEAKKIAQAIAKEIGKFMTSQGIPTKESQSQ